MEGYEQVIWEEFNKREGEYKIIKETKQVLDFSNRTGQADQCRVLFDESIAIAQKLRDKSLECHILEDMAESYNKSGNYEESRKITNKALLMALEIGDKEKECALTGNLGEIAENKGNLSEARQQYETALNIANEIHSYHYQDLWRTKLNEL